jgi:micrococcal nuclease
MPRELFLLATFLVNLFFGHPTTKQEVKGFETSSGDLVKVVRVVDGDTIEIEGNKKIRLIGVNAPESVAPNKKIACFGHEASNFTKEQLEGKLVKLEKDVSETDKYGRLLRYVHLGGVLFNEELVKNGYAQASTYPPDVKYKDRFLDAQRFARDNNLGLWKACK